MATKVLNTRISLKIDTLENWQKSTLQLRNGEVAIATASATVGTGLQEPVCMLKIGNPENKTFNELPWSFYAKAADVLAACKTEEGLRTFINGVIADAGIATDEALTAVRNDVSSLKTLVGNTAVATQISSAIAALNLETTYETKGAAAAVKTALLGDAADGYNTLGKLEDAVIAAQAAADSKTTMAAVEAKDYATKTEAQGYANAVLGAEADSKDKNTVYGAKAYAKNLNDASNTRIAALETAVGEGGSVADAISSAIGNLDVPEVAVGQGEIIEKISETDGKIAVSKRALVAADIPTIAQSQVDGLTTALAGKQAALSFEGTYNAESNKVTTKSYVDSVIAGLNGAMHFEGKVTGATFEEAVAGKTYEAGDVVLYGYEERVYDGTEWHILGNETIYAVKGEIVDANIKDNAAIAQSKIAGLTDALAAKANTADLGSMASETATNYVKKTEAVGYADILTQTSASSTYETKTDAAAKLTAAKTYTDDEIGKLAMTQVTAAAGTMMNTIVQTNGKIEVTTRDITANDIPVLAQDKISGLATALAAKANDADLAAIAKSGSVMDLVQGAEDVLILDCGGSN